MDPIVEIQNYKNNNDDNTIEIFNDDSKDIYADSTCDSVDDDDIIDDSNVDYILNCDLGEDAILNCDIDSSNEDFLLDTDEDYTFDYDDDIEKYVKPVREETEEDKLIKSLNSLLIEVEKMLEKPNISSFSLKPKLEELCEGKFNIIGSSVMATNLMCIIDVNIFNCCIKFMFEEMKPNETLYDLKFEFETLCASMENVIKNNPKINDQIILVNNKILEHEITFVEKMENDKNLTGKPSRERKTTKFWEDNEADKKEKTNESHKDHFGNTWKNNDTSDYHKTMEKWIEENNPNKHWDSNWKNHKTIERFNDYDKSKDYDKNNKILRKNPNLYYGNNIKKDYDDINNPMMFKPKNKSNTKVDKKPFKYYDSEDDIITKIPKSKPINIDNVKPIFSKEEDEMLAKLSRKSYIYDDEEPLTFKKKTKDGEFTVSFPDETPHWSEGGEFRYNNINQDNKNINCITTTNNDGEVKMKVIDYDEIKPYHKRFYDDIDNVANDNLSKYHNSNVTSKYINM